MQSAAPNKPFVLCVDDDPAMAMLPAYNLEKSGFDTACVEDGQSALRVIEQVRPHLVILDWTIPRLSGLQVLRWIRNSVMFEHMPVVMVTGRGERDDRRTALQSGASAFFHKPFSLTDLTDTVRRQIKSASTVNGALT
jgi:two-component system, OmpR family, phosphate regulon response regulator PhoB